MIAVICGSRQQFERFATENPNVAGRCLNRALSLYEYATPVISLDQAAGRKFESVIVHESAKMLPDSADLHRYCLANIR